MPMEQLGKLDFAQVLAGKELSPVQFRLDRFQDICGRMAENHGSLGQGIVNEFVAIDIPDTGPGCPLEEHGTRLAQSAEMAADSTCQCSLRPPVKLFGPFQFHT
jgi:hypothetical protein